MKRYDLPEIELLHPGHVGCAGCGASIALKFALKALGPDTVVIMPACCWAVLSGTHPYTALNVPVLHTAFESAGAAASGVRAALDIQGRTETTVAVWAGDGGTFDIGFQALSGAAERNEDFIYICYDNEAYMNTGVQRSSATPYGSRTTTTPPARYKNTGKKNMVEAMAAHRIPYAATASMAFPDDMMRKIRKAKDLRGGTRFLHVFASCPTGWGIASDMAVKIARLAVQTNAFPLYEVEDGRRYTLNYRGDRPVEDYLKPQGRFRHLKADDLRDIQARINADWEWLLEKIDTTNNFPMKGYPYESAPAGFETAIPDDPGRGDAQNRGSLRKPGVHHGTGGEGP